MSYSGKVTTYDLTVGQKIDIDELIYMISPVDSPLINGVAADGKSVLASSGVSETTFKWMDEEILLPRAAASAVNAATGASMTSITVAAADSYKFQLGGLQHDCTAKGGGRKDGGRKDGGSGSLMQEIWNLMDQNSGSDDLDGDTSKKGNADVKKGQQKETRKKVCQKSDQCS